MEAQIPQTPASGSNQSTVTIGVNSDSERDPLLPRSRVSAYLADQYCHELRTYMLQQDVYDPLSEEEDPDGFGYKTTGGECISMIRVANSTFHSSYHTTIEIDSFLTEAAPGARKRELGENNLWSEPVER